MNCLTSLGVETNAPTDVPAPAPAIAPRTLAPANVAGVVPSNFPPAPIPSTGTALPDVQVIAFNSDKVMGNCVGDCDSDADCAGTLKCFQRITGDDKTYLVPGCAEPIGVDTGIDICYDASFVKNPGV
jgi:hypothetical protein